MSYGLMPVRNLQGAAWDANLMKCFIPATDTNAMFVGDPVDLAGSASPDATCPTVVLATAGANNRIYGVIVGFEPDPTNLNLRYRPASTARYCYVCIDPYTVYRVKANTTAVLGPADVGLNANLASGTGNTVTGLSGWTLNSGSTGTNATFQLLILRAVPDPSNDVSVAGAHWEVIISLHRLQTTAVSGSIAGVLGV